MIANRSSKPLKNKKRNSTIVAYKNYKKKMTSGSFRSEFVIKMGRHQNFSFMNFILYLASYVKKTCTNLKKRCVRVNQTNFIDKEVHQAFMVRASLCSNFLK